MFDADPKVEGLILHKHGIFTFGADAREAYERMIEMVTLAEERLADEPQGGVRRGATAAARRAARRGRADRCAAPAACPTPQTEGAWRRLVLEFRGGDAILNFVNGADVARYARPAWSRPTTPSAPRTGR